MDMKNLYLIGLLICIVMVSGCTLQPDSQSPLEQACLSSGGNVTTQLCCGSASDFPNTCQVGACGCSLENSKEVKFCDCGKETCFNGNSCVALMPPITNFEECVAAGYPIMKSNPPQCMTPDGRTFIEELKDPKEQMCKNAGGNWNMCSSKCALDNQGKEGIACPMMCEALCECGGIAGFSCPEGYNCIIKSDVADALGYCEPAEVIGGQRDEHGCLGPAGYSWDETVSACIRPWELNESQKEAAKFAIAPLSYPVTVTAVEIYQCPGCFKVSLQRNDNQQNFDVEYVNWTVSELPEVMPPLDDTLIKNQTCQSESSGKTMSLTEALSIASASECVQNATLTDRHSCNSVTGTWWIDLNLEKEGCSPACVVNVDTKTAEINWRCTGLLVPE